MCSIWTQEWSIKLPKLSLEMLNSSISRMQFCNSFCSGSCGDKHPHWLVHGEWDSSQSLLWQGHQEQPWTGHRNPGELFHSCVLGEPSAQLLGLGSTVVVHVQHSSLQNEPRLSSQEKTQPSQRAPDLYVWPVASQHQQGQSHPLLHSEHHLPFSLTFAAFSPYSLYSEKVPMSLRRTNVLPLNYWKRHKGLFCHPNKISHSTTKMRWHHLEPFPTRLCCFVHRWLAQYLGISQEFNESTTGLGNQNHLQRELRHRSIKWLVSKMHGSMWRKHKSPEL